MQLKKEEILVLQKVLIGTEDKLNFADARIRDKFLKALVEEIQAYYEARNKLLVSIAEPIEGEENRFNLTPKFMEEEKVLNEEEVELPDEPKLREFIELSEYKPKIGEIDLIDSILSKI
jgi:hypothetical protein